MWQLALAGIALTAAAISWWNGKRIDEVNGEISRLEDRLQEIYDADERKRSRLIEPYLLQLAALFTQELRSRDAIASELARAHTQARVILKKRFGPRESARFRRVVLDLELALGRIDAERAWLRNTGNDIRGMAGTVPADMPSVQWLALPEDYPRDGLILPASGKLSGSLHGYGLRADGELQGGTMLYHVDHQARTARVGDIQAFLLEAALSARADPIEAVVQTTYGRVAKLEYRGAILDLRLKSEEGGWLRPGAEVPVWADGWTLDDIIHYDKRPEALPVRLTPGLSDIEEYWWPVALGVEDHLVDQILDLQAHFQEPSCQDRPWRIYPRDDGRMVFHLGRYGLVTSIDAVRQCFRLHSVFEDETVPDEALRCYVALNPVAFDGEGEGVGLEARNRFDEFVEVLAAELEMRRRTVLQRNMALRLRKLSLIYQEQQAYLAQNASCGFLPGRVERRGQVVTGTLCEPRVPAWLASAASAQGASRLRAVGKRASWRVRKIDLVDSETKIFRLELDVPGQISQSEIDPFNLFRLELEGETDQKQILAKGLETAILGQFSSASVHEALFALDGGQEGSADASGKKAVMALLRSQEPVVAVWGPPGTGKTTTLVEWLLELFPEGGEQSWPRILVTGPTNVAVNNLLQSLLKKAPYLADTTVRYGIEDKIGEDLMPYWHQHFQSALGAGDPEIDQELHAEWKTLLRRRKGRAAANRWLFRGKKIHGATCTGMARADFSLMVDPFDLVIVDEAGKAFAAELMLPASVSRRLVLVGDHNQLPPTVTSDVLDQKIGYSLPMVEVEELLKKNFFQDVYEGLPAHAKGMLTVQYRMHEVIGDLVSRLFYESRLESDRKAGHWSLTKARLSFVDFSAVPDYRHQRQGLASSLDNELERSALMALLVELDSRVDAAAPLSILVICPYKAQLEMVRDALSEAKLPGLSPSAATVDAVQGGEADVVILLMTRAYGPTEFLLDRYRMNVAFSRARDAVIVMGSLACLARNGQGPIAEMVALGRENQTLNLLRLKKQDPLAPTLVSRLFPRRPKQARDIDPV